MEIEKQKFLEHFEKSLEKNSFVKIIFGKYRGGDKEFENIFVTRIKLNEGERLSFKFKYRTKDIVKNYEFRNGLMLAGEILGKDFLSGTLFTTENDFAIDYSKKRVPRLDIKKPTQTNAAVSTHNKVKSRFVNSNSKYFYLLGITGLDGSVKADKYDKFRQVDKFIEILDSLYRSTDLQEKEKIKIIDLGSGKSYLTFAMYDYFRNRLNKKVEIKGIEQKEELVKLSNNFAEECEFEGLTFVNGNIENAEFENADIAVALHACDTATDDAIFKAVESKAGIILLAPCCHKYVRKKINIPGHLNGIYKHGILLERLAVTVTDALRALTLEYLGYESKVFEFISSEHTAKNTMITAVKKNALDENKLSEISAIKKEFSIEDFYLDNKFKEMKYEDEPTGKKL